MNKRALRAELEALYEKAAWDFRTPDVHPVLTPEELERRSVLEGILMGDVKDPIKV